MAESIMMDEILDTLARHKVAINELGEREDVMTKEFQALKAAFEEYKARIDSAVVVIKNERDKALAEADVLQKQIAALNEELSLPHEDVDSIVELTNVISNAAR